jgi:hypothetical protein
MDEILETNIHCDQLGCNVAVDGKCIDGFELGKCPHYKMLAVNESEKVMTGSNVESNSKEPKASSFFEIYSGESLDINETVIVTSASPTKLIIIAGLPDFGKTTLLASIFDLFQRKQSFASYSFTGSKTLIGFERICHHSRIASERARPDTERTTNINPKFLHLGIKDAKSNTELLFTDISGEYFRDYISISFDECKKFEIAKRADHFVLIIDSDLLSTIESRQNTKTSSLIVLRSLIDAEMLNSDTYVQILFSKWDLLLDKEDKEDHIKYIDSTIEDIKRKFSMQLRNLSFHKIASRPIHPNELQQGFGFEDFFKIWVNNSPYQKELTLDNYPEMNISSREFSKYKV